MKLKGKKINVKRLALILIIAILVIVAVVFIFSFIIKFLSPEKVAGNYSNIGLAVNDGKTVYYNKYEVGIFKVKNKKETQLTSETAYSMTLVKNQLYYLTVSPNNTIDLKCISTNGENNKLIASLSTSISKFYIEDNYVFYVTNRERMRLIKMSLNNLEETTLVESGIQDFVLSKGKIYYSDNNGSLYSINTDGTEQLEISKDYLIRNFQILKNWIYFYDIKENALCKIKVNGKAKQTVSRFVTNEIYNVTSKNIYYYDNSNKQICKSDLKGKKSIAIVKVETAKTRINIVKGILYYLDNSQNENQIYQMFRVKTNGSATNSIVY